MSGSHINADSSASPAVHDPTILTTRQLLREIESLEKRFDQRVSALDKAVALAHEDLVRVPTAVDKAVAGIEKLFNEKLKTFDEKFISVQTQFSERDTRSEDSIANINGNVDKALKALNEFNAEQNKSSALAIGKSEASTTKQIDQINTLINTSVKSLDDKIDDVKQRLTSLEAGKRGEKVATESHQASSAGAINIIGLIVGAVIGIGGLVVAAASHLAK